MFNPLKKLFEKSPLEKLEKLTAEQLIIKQHELEHEIQASLAEGKQRQQDIEKQLLKGADAADWEVDIIAENCAMIQDEIKSLRDEIIALQKMKSVVHTLHLLKKSKVGIARQTREGLQKLMGADTIEDLTVAVATIRQSLGAELADISQVADDLKTEMAATEIPITTQAKSFKEQMTAMKAVESTETREQMAKDRAKEMLQE